MKIWHAYASEHSANLVLIGHFDDARKAKGFGKLVESIQEQVREEDGKGELDYSNPTMSDAVAKLLRDNRAYSLGNSEMLQFALEYHLEIRDSTVTIRTDEVEVSALLKLMIDGGAKVEVYSAHDHPDVTDANTAKE